MANEYTLGGPPPQSRSEKILMKQNPGPAQSRIEELLKNASSERTAGALVYKGTVETALSLPASGNEIGDVYHVNSDGSEWAWNGEQWEELGKSIAIDAVLYTAQTLTPAQQAQARENIGAGTYSKSSGGIPASDLAAGVIPTVPQMATAADTTDWTQGKTVDAAVLKTGFRNALAELDDVQDEVARKANASDIPTAVSDLTNDSDYQTAQDVATAIAAIPAVRYDVAQSLTDAQQEQARENIGAVAKSELIRVSAESIGITTSDETGINNSKVLNSYIADNAASKTIYFRNGTYKFANPISVTTSTNFVGDGKDTVLEFTGDGTFLNSTVYFAPNFYNMTIKGSGSGLGFKIGDKSANKASCRGVMFNVHFSSFDVAIEPNYGWGWVFLSVGAERINEWLFHVTGVWNTSNIIGGEYEYQSGGGVFWDANSGSNAVNFIGIVWESLTSHVFKVDDNAANISVNIEGAYFENSKEYNDQVSTAHLIYSNNEKAVFNFVGETSVGYYQVIKSAGLVKNPPEKALLALGGYRQPFVNPCAKLCAVQSPDYQIHHGMVFDLEGKTFYTRPDKYDGSTSVFPVDGLGINFTAYNASWVAYKNQFDASTPVRQMVLRLPDGAFDLANVNVGFEFAVPSNFDWSTVASGIINIIGVTDGSSHLTAFDRYLKMLGTDVTESYDRYQHFRYFRNAEVSSPTVTLGGKNYYELQIAVPSAEVIITKVIIDDGKQIFATNKLIDAITSGEKQVFETIDQSGSINVSLNGGITNLVLHGKTSTATGKNLCSLDTATWTGVKEFACDPIPAGDYYFSGHFEGGNPDATAYAVMFYDANNNRLVTKTTPNNADRIGFPVSFSAPCVKIAFYAGSGWPGSQGFTATWSDLQIESGSTPTSYEPYGATGDLGISPTVRLGNKTLSAVGVSQLFDGDSFDFVNCAYYKASDNTTTPAAINGSVNKVAGDVAVSAGGDVFVGYVTDQ